MITAILRTNPLCHCTGLHTRSVIDAIIESSATGSWSQVDFVSSSESDKSQMGSEEKMPPVSNEQQKENPDEKEYPSPVMRRMLTQ